MSKIEWTEETWNPTVGCTRTSTGGCKNCYAATMHNRLQAMGQKKYQHNFNVVQLVPSELDRPLSWKKPRRIFVNSMSDLFHEDLPFDDIFRVFQTMMKTPRHTYQVLTKRADRILDFEAFAHADIWKDNIWLGVSVENQKAADLRIPNLITSSAKIKFLSCEPLLGPVDIEPFYRDIDWVIVGGESGPRSKIRKMELQWVRDLMNQCIENDIRFFYKQSGTLQPCTDPAHSCTSKGCKYLDGQLYQDFPGKIHYCQACGLELYVKCTCEEERWGHVRIKTKITRLLEILQSLDSKGPFILQDVIAAASKEGIHPDYTDGAISQMLREGWLVEQNGLLYLVKEDF